MEEVKKEIKITSRKAEEIERIIEMLAKRFSTQQILSILKIEIHLET